MSKRDVLLPEYVKAYILKKLTPLSGYKIYLRTIPANASQEFLCIKSNIRLSSRTPWNYCEVTVQILSQSTDIRKAQFVLSDIKDILAGVSTFTLPAIETTLPQNPTLLKYPELPVMACVPTSPLLDLGEWKPGLFLFSSNYVFKLDTKEVLV